MEGLGIHVMQRSKAGSSMFIEYFIEDKQLFTRIYYKNSFHDPEQIIHLPGQTEDKFHFDAFIKYIEKQLDAPGDILETYL